MTNIAQQLRDGCPALIKVNILDGESPEAKKFCINKCPYPDCILVMGRIKIRKLEKANAIHHK